MRPRLILPLLAFLSTLLGTLTAGLGAQEPRPPRPPNLVLILADDLGYGELGCYGQQKIRTPHLDRLASEGMRFTQHYAGAPVCAPSRCVLLTGKHLAHAAVRDNREERPEGQFPLPDAEITLAELLREQGYATACVGKWGLGPVGSSGDPNRQGFDLFYGYNCQRQAHNYFPPYLWLNRERHLLDNPEFRAHQRLDQPPGSYDRFQGRQYAPELMVSQALAFIRRNLDRPFFLYLALVEPHLAMQPPPEWVDRYPRSWDQEPYLGQKGYLPHPRPRAGYAAMISHLDDHVGRVVALIDELELGPQTLILFTSDNGPTHDVGGVDTSFFESAGPLRGRKGSVFEGGLRVPFIARWSGRVPSGSTTDHLSYFPDVLPTLVEASGGTPPIGVDGLSFLATLLGSDTQAEHRWLLWEFPGYGGQQAIRQGRWKAVRRQLQQALSPFRLFDLETDISESQDLSAEHPEVLAALEEVLRSQRAPHPAFPIKALDG